MKKYTVWGHDLDDYAISPDEGESWVVVYLADDVDARIAELEEALREAIEWNWMQDSVPTEVIEQIAAALGVPATEL